MRNRGSSPHAAASSGKVSSQLPSSTSTTSLFMVSRSSVERSSVTSASTLGASLYTGTTTESCGIWISGYVERGETDELPVATVDVLARQGAEPFEAERFDGERRE